MCGSPSPCGCLIMQVYFQLFLIEKVLLGKEEERTRGLHRVYTLSLDSDRALNLSSPIISLGILKGFLF